MIKRLRMHRRSDAAVQALRPHPASFKRTLGLFRQSDGDICFVVAHPDGKGDIYVPVPPEIACLIRQDLEDMLECTPDGTPRPVVPLNEPLSSYYARGGVTRDRHGGVVVNVGMPGGDLLVKLDRPAALALLRDLASDEQLTTTVSFEPRRDRQ